MARAWILAASLLFATAFLVACGGDDDSSDSTTDHPVFDGGGPTPDAPPGGGIDAAAGGQAIGHFCETLPEGGPYCAGGLDCCVNVCREPSDCEGSAGYVPCDHGSDCGGKVCCRVPSMTFCTKPSACTAYGGDVIP